MGSKRQRLIAALVLVVLTAILGLELLGPDGILSDGLVRTSYDTLHRLSPEKPLDNSPVAIVYLDLAAYFHEHQDPTQPWPRALHAQLIRRLAAAGARAVVFDIIFSGPGRESSADEALANAIREQGKVVLAAEYSDKSSHVIGENEVGARLHRSEPPYGPFAQAAAAYGNAEQINDDDFVVRRYLAGFTDGPKPTLTWAAASLLGLPVTQGNEAMQRANQHWVRYYGPALTVPHVGYVEALDPKGVPDEFFRDKIVFVGAQPMVETFQARQDNFRNPFHYGWRNRESFMPGVEVHATELLNLVRGNWLHRLNGGQEAALLLLCACVFGGVLVRFRPIPATLIALGGEALTLGLASSGFSHGVWFPWLIVSAAQIPAALGGAVLFYSIEWYRARRRFEARIREQAALIEKAHDAILVQDLEGRITYVNSSAERLYGWKMAELQQNGAAAELFSPDPSGTASARSVALEKGEWNGELKLQTRSGGIITVDSRWTLIRDEASQPKALLLINSDITEKKELEAQFLRTQRMNTIGSLAGGMVHDLNNALAPILMGVQVLRRKTSDEESKNLLGLMETNTHRSADMVRQVLLFARGRGGEFERLELPPLVSELEKMIRETFPKSISIESFLPRDLWPVRGNPTQLHQVLLNLCVNARDAMPGGGRLSFAADNVELAAKEAEAITGASPGQYVSLLVSDTGAGMSAEVRKRIFEPFFTTKAEGKGTGIGLATVLRIVKAHGGFLRVESEPGQGTTFEVFLPRASEAVPAQLKPALNVSALGRGEVILVVDDEQAIRDLVAESLSVHGYRVLTAANGEEAVRLFRRHEREVRLLVTDSAMPVMDGPKTILQLRKLRPDLPIILASGEAQVENGAPTHGIFLLSKPFSLEELLAAIHHLLPASQQKTAEHNSGKSERKL
jgi:PAS domain S-box-containing protein